MRAEEESRSECGLRQHRGEIGDRQRLPEQNAAIAAFPVQGIDRVEHPDDKSGAHDQVFGELVGLPGKLRCCIGSSPGAACICTSK